MSIPSTEPIDPDTAEPDVTPSLDPDPTTTPEVPPETQPTPA